MTRIGFWLCAVIAYAAIGLGLAACGSSPPSSDVTPQECQWGVGCTPQCTIKYGRSSYCDGD